MSVTQPRFQLLSSSFFLTIVPLVYFFIQHKVHRIPGGDSSYLLSILLVTDPLLAYTHYAFFEWGLIFFDVLYDSIAEQEFREADLQAIFFLLLCYTLSKSFSRFHLVVVSISSQQSCRHNLCVYCPNFDVLSSV